MTGPYVFSAEWIRHSAYTPSSRLTLRATVAANSGPAGPGAGRAVNAFLRTFRPAWVMLDGVPTLVAHRGAVFVTLASSSNPQALTPDLFIHATGAEACDEIEDAASELYTAVTAAEPGADFEWEELSPREFDHV